MSTANRIARPFLIGGLGLAATAAFVAFCALVAAAVLGVFLATGTLQHTSQGWSFRAGAFGSNVSSQTYDPKMYSLLVQRGTGSQQTASITSAGSWILNWAYDCPTSSGSIQLVARSAQGATYPAGTLDGSRGAGQSNVLPAGTYSVQIATGAQCTWSVGARPQR